MGKANMITNKKKLPHLLRVEIKIEIFERNPFMKIMRAYWA
jgi:hypothetical protein